MNGIERTIVIGAGVVGLAFGMTSTSWAATGFSATNIGGGSQASTLSTTHSVSVGDHLVCGGHPTNVTGATQDRDVTVFRVSPFLPVAGGRSITCVKN